MNLEYRTGKPDAEETDLLVLPVFQVKGEADLSPWKAVDAEVDNWLSERVSAERFVARRKQMLLADTPELPCARVMLLGLGSSGSFTSETFRRAVGAATKVAEYSWAEHVTVALPAGTGVDTARLTRAAAEGALLATYRFTVYKEENKRGELDTMSIVGNSKAKKILKELEVAELSAAGTNAARDLVNEPAGVLTPTEFANRAKKLSGQGVSVKIHNKAALQKLGANTFLGVASGSFEPPCMIELHYKPKTKAKRKIAVIGKGITFDSGGLSLKPPKGMETMKCDMGGGAAVFGLFHALRQLQPKVEVVGLIGATENMPGNHAQRPGDVVKSMSGKTVEILNTDAEGRLVLADVLWYAHSKHKPAMMVDLATLTGACVVALGDWTAAVYSNDDKAGDSLLKAAEVADEKVWHMPLDDDLRSKLDSPIADVKNVGDRAGGSITAALFLREFVGDTPWIHMDIAGPAFAETNPVVPGTKGGTGFGVRTLIEWVRSA